jgi:hypothetical protein
VTFHFRETSGEVWKSVLPIGAAQEAGILFFNLDATLQWDPSSAKENGEADLGAIDSYGLQIGHSGPGLTGSLVLGENFFEPFGGIE